MSTPDLYTHQSLQHYYGADHLSRRLDNPPSTLSAFLASFDRAERRVHGINLGCGLGTSLLHPDAPGTLHGVDFNPKLAPLWKKRGLVGRTEVADVGLFLEKSADYYEYCLSCDFLEHLPSDEASLAYLLGRVRDIPAGWHEIDLLAQSAFRGPKKENLHTAAGAPWRKLWEEASDGRTIHIERYSQRALHVWWNDSESGIK